jgi:hypothetical protein
MRKLTFVRRFGRKTIEEVWVIEIMFFPVLISISGNFFSMSGRENRQSLFFMIGASTIFFMSFHSIIKGWCHMELFMIERVEISLILVMIFFSFDSMNFVLQLRQRYGGKIVQIWWGFGRVFCIMNATESIGNCSVH